MSEVRLRLPRGVKERIPTPLYQKLTSLAPATPVRTNIQNILNLKLNSVINHDRRWRAARLPTVTGYGLLENGHMKHIVNPELRR